MPLPSILKITYDAETGYCTLHHRFNKRFIDFIVNGIKPLSYRHFDGTIKKWKVHRSKLPFVLSAGRKYFDGIDDREIPLDIKKETQDEIKSQSFRFGDYNTPIEKQNIGPHATFYLIESAPWSVVQAVYKVLAKENHPDMGGDQIKFIEIQKAYEDLKKIYGV